jgi:hypothetical protein
LGKYIIKNQKTQKTQKKTKKPTGLVFFKSSFFQSWRQAGQGALEAARAHAAHPARVQLRGFTYLSSLDHSSPQLVSFLQSGDQL